MFPILDFNLKKKAAESLSIRLCDQTTLELWINVKFGFEAATATAT